MYIFKPNVDHMIESSKFKSLSIVELKFYCNNTVSESMIYQLPSIIKDVGQPIRTSFINIVEEVQLQDKYTEYIIKALLTHIIFSLIRISDQETNYSYKK